MRKDSTLNGKIMSDYPLKKQPVRSLIRLIYTYLYTVIFLLFKRIKVLSSLRASETKKIKNHTSAKGSDIKIRRWQPDITVIR